MILVVADSSPVRYLVVVEAIELLPQLYDRIVLPPVVVAELTHPNAPHVVREWASKLPDWVEVLSARSGPPRELEEILDAGELAAITLAQEIHADFVLLDEREARRVAIASGLKIAGTVGMLELAAEKGLIDLKEYFKRLQTTNFRIDAEFLKEALVRDAARRER